MKTVVFDFDNTLTTMDTIFPFLYFVNNDGLLVKTLKKSVLLLCRLAYRLKMISNDQLKSIAVKLLIGGYSEESIERSVNAFFNILNFHDAVYRELEKHLADKETEVIISTASFVDYIDEFKKAFPNLNIQASELDYVDGKVNGLKYNNYGSQKLRFWSKKNIDLLYTDALSDLPLAKIANQIYFVSKNGTIQECDSLAHFVQQCKR